MYKNIIFDLGGVVVDYAPREFLVDHFLNEKVENELFDITFGSAEWLLLDSGEISREEGNALMLEKGAAIGRTFEVKAILSDWMDMLRTKDNTVQLMKRLKQNGYRLFCLSNISQDALDLMRERKFWKLFNGGIASCEVNLTKPDPAIFKMLLKQYGLAPQECIFIDDNRENVIAAKNCGITSTQFHNVRLLARILTGLNVSVAKKAAQPAHTPPKVNEGASKK